MRALMKLGGIAGLMSLAQLAAAQDFDIAITAPTDGTTPTVTATGSTSAQLSVQERVDFNVSFWPMDKAITTQIGLGPKAIYLNDPTQNGNIFAEFGWAPTVATTTVLKTTVSVPEQQVVTLDTAHFCNGQDEAETFTASLTSSTVNSMSSGWSTTRTASDAITVGVKATVGPAEVSGSNTLTLTTSAGKNGSTSQQSTISRSESVTLKLKPGEKALAVLSATKGSLDVTIEYAKSLSGTVFANYEPAYKGHHFYDFDVESLMETIGVPNQKTYSQTITLDYYHTATISTEPYDGECSSGTGG